VGTGIKTWSGGALATLDCLERRYGAYCATLHRDETGRNFRVLTRPDPAGNVSVRPVGSLERKFAKFTSETVVPNMKYIHKNLKHLKFKTVCMMFINVNKLYTN